MISRSHKECGIDAGTMKDLSPRAVDLIADRFKVLSEPTRLKLIIALQDGERNVTELVETTGATQANVSRQLQKLAEAGILARRKQGLKVYYSIADPSIFRLCDAVCGSLRSFFEGQHRVFD